MGNIFSGLENLGFDNLNGLKVYEEKKQKQIIVEKIVLFVVLLSRLNLLKLIPLE